MDIKRNKKTQCQHQTFITRGFWGPHRAKEQCFLCGEHIKWVAVTKSPYERRKGIKFKDFLEKKVDKS